MHKYTNQPVNKTKTNQMNANQTKGINGNAKISGFMSEYKIGFTSFYLIFRHTIKRIHCHVWKRLKGNLPYRKLSVNWSS